MHNSVDVAYKMLQVAEEKKIYLSNLQLQKLVYIAHGYMLGWQGEPIFEGDVTAWKYGPVINLIYHQFKRFGSDKIEGLDLSSLSINLSEESDEVISGVLDMYGKDDAMSLVNLTHQKETPWDIIWNVERGCEELFAVIPNDLIKDHYRAVISNPESVNGL